MQFDRDGSVFYAAEEVPPGVLPAASDEPSDVPPAAEEVPPGVPPAAEEVPPGVPPAASPCQSCRHFHLHSHLACPAFRGLFHTYRIC